MKESRKRSSEELKQRLAAAVYPSLQTFNRYGTEWRARLHVRTGKPDEQISALAADIRADLIVIGQFGLHNPREKYKTVPNRVLNAATCPTLVVGMPQEADTSPVCPSAPRFARTPKVSAGSVTRTRLRIASSTPSRR